MAEIVATEPEIIVLRWLDKHKIVYDFQTSLAGGRFELGGSVLDFILTDLAIGLRVQSMYWHEGVAKKGTDDIQREMLEGMGLTIVDVWQDDLEQRLEETMRLAVQGQEMLR